MTPALISLLVLTTAIAFAVAGYLWKGYVLSILWGWFIVPFFGLAPLTVPMAIGVVLIASFLTSRYLHIEDERRPSEKLASVAGHEFLYPAVVLGVGWIVLQFL
jgi:hypothetical protein